MKKDKFDTLSEKLINILDEDYETLTEVTMDPLATGDEENHKIPEEKIPDDPQEGTQKTLKAQELKAEAEKEKAFVTQKVLSQSGNIPTKTVKAVRMQHLKGINKVEEIKAKKRTLRANQLLKEDLDQMDDVDMYILGEEFEMDLNEGDTMEKDVTTKTMALNDVRSDLQGELTAIKDYDTHADQLEKAGMVDAAEILRDIRDEEKVHVGELQKVMDKYDAEYEKSVEDGKEEAGKELKPKSQVEELKEAILAMSLREENIRKAQKKLNKETAHVEKFNDKVLIKIRDIEYQIKELQDKYPRWNDENDPKMRDIRKKIQKLMADKNVLTAKKENAENSLKEIDPQQVNLEWKKKRKEEADGTEGLNEDIVNPDRKTTACPEFATKSYENPMLNKIASQIRAEYENDVVDVKRIRELTLKFNQYKK